MFQKEFSSLSTATPETLWPHYAEVSRWKVWDEAVEQVTLEGAFAKGSRGTLKLHGKPALDFTLTEVTPNVSFSDETKVGPMTVRFTHTLERLTGGTKVTHRVSIEGPGADGLGAKSAATMPYLSELKKKAAHFTALSPFPSLSRPGYTTILTGAPPEITGVSSNIPHKMDARIDSFVRRAHSAGWKTAMVGLSWWLDFFDADFDIARVDSGYDAGDPIFTTDARVEPGIAKNRDHQVRTAVDHLGLVDEIWGRVHEAHQFHHPREPVKIPTAGLFQLCQQRDRAALCCRRALFHRQILAQAALDQPVFVLADLARDIDMFAGHDEGHIVGRRGRGIGKGDAKFGKAGFDRVHGWIL